MSAKTVQLVDAEGNRVCILTSREARQLMKSGKARPVPDSRMFTIGLIDEASYRDELRRQTGRRIPGTTRGKFCGEYGHGGTQGRCFPRKR